MKSALRALAALALAFPPGLSAQTNCNTATIPVCSVTTPTRDVQIKPQAVPTSTTNVAFSDAYLKGITVNNPTSGAIAFSICDRQATPVCVPGAASVAANTTYILVWPDGRLYWCPGGFSVLAASAGLTFYGVWRQ